MFLKSKLQNPDPEIRRQHVQHLAPEDELLIQLALTDSHPDVRSAALTRIIDLDTLQKLAEADAETTIRSLAIARLQTLLTGAEDPTPPFETRLKFLSASGDSRLIRFVARSAPEPELRKVAVANLLDRKAEPDVQDLLCEIAAEDSVLEIREMAAQPIHDVKRLQTLLENSRDRDKSIYRLARDRLDAIQAQRDAQEVLDNCCLDIEQLGAHHFSPDGKSEEVRLARIVADWDKAAATVDVLDPNLLARYSTARDGIEVQLAEIATQRRKRADIMESLQLHLSEATASEPVAELIKRWHELDEPTPAQARDFSKLIAEVTEHDSQIERDNHRIVAKQALLDKMEQAAAAQSIRDTVLPRFEERWQGAPDPDDDARKSELQARFLSLREKLRAKHEKQVRELEERLEKVIVLVDQYETSLEEGKLQIVVSTHDKIVNALNQLEAPAERKQILVKRLRAGEPKMAELRQWRHWGTDRKREELCESIETLPTAGLKIPAVARAVRESRDAWKALDKSDGPAGKNLWKRFDAACEKAYEPCQAHFDQQKKQRKENMARRVAICEALEALQLDTDWDAPPWRDLADKLREAERNWHMAGSVDRREKNTIQTRYDQARAALDEHLGAKRQQEIERREALINQVEALAAVEDMARAIDTAKRAQRDWKPVVQSGRRQEQELWQRFRTACDAVFERRKEQFAAADSERSQNLAEKLAVCGQFDEIVTELKAGLDAGTGDPDLVSETRKKARQLTSGWQRIGPVPREKQQAVDRQFSNAARELEQLCARLDRQLKQKAKQAMRDAAADCDRLELAFVSGDSIDLAAVEQIVDKVGPSPGTTGVARRIKRLQAAAGGDEKAQKEIREALPSNLETRLRVCLVMEIAANIDSPEEFRESRMQYRVRQLSASMSGNRQQMTPAQLESLWYETGPVPEPHKAGLEQRFHRALDALSGD